MHNDWTTGPKVVILTHEYELHAAMRLIFISKDDKFKIILVLLLPTSTFVMSWWAIKVHYRRLY